MRLPRSLPALLRFALAAMLACAASASGNEAPSDADECGALAALDFSEAVGAAVSLRGEMLPAAGALPARCRVTGTVAPEVGVEIWLPADAWNGRLLVAGCYGLCGSIRADQMEDAAERGYATATTDSGHSDQKYPDSRWAWNNPALEDDFGHRAVHVTTLLAKALIRGFYGERERVAYFRGCSSGGRQALVAVERYPDDFDGVIAGAPFHQALSVPHMIWADRANTGPDKQPVLRRSHFELLHRSALGACDARDGLADGIIADPEHCTVDLEAMACNAERSDDCLGPAEIEAARLIYRGPADSAGQLLAPFGAAPGSELSWEQQLIGRKGASPFFRTIGQNWMRFHAFEPDPSDDGAPLVFDFDRDPARVAVAGARVAFGPGLARFEARDGRLIVHHGWADESLQPAHTLDWWRKVLRENGGPARVRGFARLYLLPGVAHCGGGPGAGDVDYLSALERWVEEDEAPDMLVASRSNTSASTIVRQPRFPLPGEALMKRPLFPYPDVAHYRGEGNPLDPASWQRVRQ
jgi:feruloyl esterase